MLENIRLLDLEYREKDLEALRAKAAPILYDASGHAQRFDPGQPMTFVANEETPNCYGDVIIAAGWQLDNFKKNPVLMFSHDYQVAPVGTVSRIEVQGKQLIATIKWDEEDPFAAFIKGKYERNVMRAVSVGFQPLEYHEMDIKQGKRAISFDKSELLELSVVAIPAHPGALRQAMGARRFQIITPEIITVEDDAHGLSAFDVTTIRAAMRKMREG